MTKLLHNRNKCSNRLFTRTSCSNRFEKRNWDQSQAKAGLYNTDTADNAMCIWCGLNYSPTGNRWTPTAKLETCNTLCACYLRTLARLQVKARYLLTYTAQSMTAAIAVYSYKRAERTVRGLSRHYRRPTQSLWPTQSVLLVIRFEGLQYFQ